MNSYFSISEDHLGTLIPSVAVEVFRDLLWAEARRKGVPISKIRISCDITTPDGGVDAWIEENALNTDADLLLAGNTHYQIKTGDNTKPWRKAWVKKELFGPTRRKTTAENLGSAVLDCLKTNGKYILVSFGCDLTKPQLKSAKDHFRFCFAQCGFPDAKVDVWGQTQLLGFLSAYPSLCLKIANRDSLGCNRSSAMQRATNLSV